MDEFNVAAGCHELLQSGLRSADFRHHDGQTRHGRPGALRGENRGAQLGSRSVPGAGGYGYQPDTTTLQRVLSDVKAEPGYELFVQRRGEGRPAGRREGGLT